MKFSFTQEECNKGLNKIEIEEDELILLGEVVEGEDKQYVITGTAVIEGETYHDFQIEFELEQLPEEFNLESIMQIDWKWYDYLC